PFATGHRRGQLGESDASILRRRARLGTRPALGPGWGDVREEQALHAFSRCSRHALSAIVIVVLGGMDTRRMVAQTGVGPERRDIATFTGDIWSVWTSPARFDGRDAAATAATIGAFALTTRFDSATRVWMTTHEGTAVMRLLSP